MTLPLGSVISVGADGRERRVDAAQVARDTQRAAAALAASGVRAGDRVVVRLPKCYEWLLALGALHRLGAVAALCPELTPDGELEARARQLGARRALLAASDLTFADTAVPDPGLRSSAPAFLVYTSGSTGEPKAAVYPRRYVRGNWLQTVRWMGVQSGDRVWCTAGTGWAKSLRNAWLAPWLRGNETVVHEARFDPDERLRLIARLRPTVLCMSPTELRLCAKSDEFERADLSSVREVVAAGEPLGADVLERYHELHGVRLRDGYGQTETGAVAGVMRGGSAAPGSLGRPLDGVDLRLDDAGEILVRAASVPTFFLGYLDSAGVQQPAALEEGWWRTGDRARIDDAGQLWFEGRADDVIISAGYRIGPAEVESALGSHPAVREAAAVARPDADRGHIVHAVVVLQPHAVASPALVTELQTHCKRVASPAKYPRSIAFAPSLPRTSSGKILRAQLRDELSALP
jgi:acyl-coenzyme A synthetase/AMP-(fatty) acid ligase